MNGSSIAHLLSDFTQNHYLAYPHSNGFSDAGHNMVVGQRGGDTFSLWLISLSEGIRTKLGEWPQRLCGEQMLWFDVASAANVLMTIVDNAIWKIDLNDPSHDAEIVYREASGELQALPSITADGAKGLVGRRLGDRYQAVEIDFVNGSVPKVLFQSEWFANHFHFSPYDENWLGISHEGPADEVGDRLWGWHQHVAPEGRCFFDNASAGLCVGHERWSFHETSAFAVAYGISSQGPRGIYKVLPEASRSSLVSEGERDWHVNVSQDGRWLVVDTTGPHDASGRGWENAGQVSDVVVIDVESGQRRFIARSCFAKEFHLHPHPVFSPDGSAVFFNEASAEGRACRIVVAENPFVGSHELRIKEGVEAV